MFPMSVEIQNDRVVIHGLAEMARKAPDAMREGLTDAVTEINRKAIGLLSGPGYKSIRIYNQHGNKQVIQDGNFGSQSYIKKRKTGYVNVLNKQVMQDGNFGEERIRVRRGIGLAGTRKGAGSPGRYPVNVFTGWLRRLQGFVTPGHTRSSGGFSFTAGRNEAVLFNSAAYAGVIHDGTHTSGKYGKRPFETDAIASVDVVSILRAAMDRAVN